MHNNIRRVFLKKAGQHILGQKAITTIITKYRNNPGELLSILEEAQKKNRYNYLPRETLLSIAEKLGISPAQIYSVVTFYSFFNLKPQGRHTITICLGTACHTWGSTKLFKQLKHLLGIKEEDIEEGSHEQITTTDNMFTVHVVSCPGQCALAPVMEVDNNICSHMNNNKLKDIIDTYKRKFKYDKT
jgi:NADH-quinone oxidoreductase subunit E